jgi:hypothetical protein
MLFDVEYMVLTIDVDCLSGGSGGSGSGGSGSGGSGSGGGGSSSGSGGSFGGTGGSTGGGNTSNPLNPSLTDGDGNPIITTPILTITKPRNHVNELNKITNRIEVKERLIALKADVISVQLEQGSEYFTLDDNLNQPLIKEDMEPKYSGIQFGDVYLNSILRVHSHHYPALEPVFSAPDILGMGFFYKEKRNLGALDADNITSILVSNLGITSLRVTDIVKAKQFSDKFVIGAFRDAFIKAYKRDVKDKAYNECNCLLPRVVYEKLLSDYLIDFLDKQNTGQTLYSGTIDSSGNYSWIIHPKYN